ncbi:hypothetical protein ABT167_05385 [Streptomyces sp. NPDC001792]|uniref:hypothetical protein n=1 Tax=Streptomyces sp. NPDC001792 TaxID=3154524 RepID=UPI003316DF23
MTDETTASTSLSPSSVDADRRKAFDVLVDSVSSLYEFASSRPTASEVRLEMKRRTYGGFDPKKLGYRRFRDFLNDAETEGLIGIDHLRQGDVSLYLPTEAEGSSAPVAIRQDLWNAFVNWNTSFSRYYDLEKEEAVLVPRDPAPLEPVRYVEFRQRLTRNPDSFIEIHPVSRETQIEWMRDFSARVRSGELKELLNAALVGPKAAKGFAAVLRSIPEVQVEWHRSLSNRVYGEILKWKEAHERLASLEIESTKAGDAVSVVSGSFPHAERVSGDGPERGQAADVAHLLALQRSSKVPSLAVGRKKDTVGDLRLRLHLAIDRMPESELRKISIPVGYLFEE